MTRSLALALMLFAFPVAADDYTIGDLVVDHPFSVETSAGVKAGAGYMAITNTGDTPDRLIAVKADFPRVMLHASVETDGIARMVHLDNGVELLPGETITFAPGGLHVMFMGLSDPLIEGASFPATLVFETAGELEVNFIVESRAEVMERHDGHGS